MPRTDNPVSVDTDAPLTPGGGVISSRKGEITISMPAGAVPAAATLALRDRAHPDVTRKSGAKMVPLLAFDIDLKDLEGKKMPGSLAAEATITFDLKKIPLSNFIIRSLVCFTLNEATNVWEKAPSQLDVTRKKMTVRTSHFSGWVIGGDTAGNISPSLQAAQTSLFTRSAEAAIDLKVPPGPNGLAPKLTLRYSSAAVNRLNAKDSSSIATAQASWAGMGWSLELGAVTRKEISGEEMFSISFSGISDRLLRKPGDPQGSNRWYLQREKFVKITHETTGGDYWLATTKDGTRYRFGSVAGSLSSDPDATNTGSRQDCLYTDSQEIVQPYIYRWLLDEITDTHGNVVTVQYSGRRVRYGTAEPAVYFDQSVYPDAIFWNNRAEFPEPLTRRPRCKVVFTRLGRQGQDDTYLPVDAPKETDILYEVNMFVNTSDSYDPNSWARMRRYFLHTSWQGIPYSYPNHLALELDYVEESGNGAPLPKMNFGYITRPLRKIGASYYHYLHFLNSFSNGYGGSTSFEYEDGPTCDFQIDGQSHQLIWQAVLAQRTSDGRASPQGAPLNQTYSSKNQDNVDTGLWFAYEDPEHPDFRGFNIVTATDELNPTYKVEHRFFQGEAPGPPQTRPRSDLTDLNDSEGLVGLEYEARWRDGETDLKKAWTTYPEPTVWNAIGPTPYDNHIYFSPPFTVQEFQGSAGSKKEFAYESAFGNLQHMYEYQGLTGNWYRHTEWAFRPNTTDPNWIVDRPANRKVFAWGDVEREFTQYYYDGNTCLPDAIPPGTPNASGWDQIVGPKGELRAVRRDSKRAGEISDTFYEYDTFGNKVKETVARGWGTSTTWGTDPVWTEWKDEDLNPGYDKLLRTFPKHVDNHLGHRTTFVYDPKWGRPLSVTDANGAITLNEYDLFGRVTKLIRPGDDAANPTERYTYWDGYLNGSLFLIRTERRKNASGGAGQYHLTWACYDGLGREMQKQVDGVSSRVYTNTYYSNRGLKRRDTVPHYVTGGVPGIDLNDWNSWYNQSVSTPGTGYQYDGLQRPIVVSSPDATQRSMSYAGWDVTLIDEKAHKKVQRRDCFGRLATVEEYTGAGPYLYAVTNYQYDVLNNMTGVTDEALNQTTITYDALSRKTQMTDPDMGTWSYVYDAAGNLMQQTDATRVKSISFTVDELNRVTRKFYPLGADDFVDNDLTVNHAPGVYDLMELRASIDVDRLAAGLAPFEWRDPAIVAGKDVTVRADHMNHMRTAISNLWSACDPPLGDLPAFTRGAVTVDPPRAISLQDPKDLRSWLAYAATNYEGSSWASEPGKGRRARVFYRYDTYSAIPGAPPSFLGQRTEVWDVSGHTRWTYDTRGRVIKEERWIDGQLYTTQWAYDAMDRVTSMTYPDGEVVSYTYNNQLLLSGMSGVGGYSYITSASFNALGKPTAFTSGAGKITSYSYWTGNVPGERPYGALRNVDVQTLQDFDYTYDDVGNVTRVDGGGGNVNSYTYDDLDRLLQRQPASGPGESFTYNQIGNITSSLSGGAYTYDATKKHAVTSLSLGGTFEYDANGNMTERNVGGVPVYFKYDGENRLVKASLDLAGREYVGRFACDGDGKRVKRVDSSGTIHYVGPHYERNVGNGQDTAEVISKFYYAQLGSWRALIAMRKGDNLFYIHSDHLGRTSVISDAWGGWAGSERYLCFGETETETGTLPTDKKFTGQTFDAATGLYFYGARYYDAHIGRFVQADTIVSRPGDPQSLNRYSYALNNPLRYVDPTGHAAQDLVSGHEDWFDDFWSGQFGPRGPQAADYVSKYIWSAEGAEYPHSTVMRDITTAIGKESPPPDSDDWLHNIVDFGSPSPKELRWGNVRLVFAKGFNWKGGLADLFARLGGGGPRAVTFSANLIVFTRELDFNELDDRKWLMHELRHVMSAQAFGDGWWWEYIDAIRRAGYENNGYEILARDFANQSMAAPPLPADPPPAHPPAQASPPSPGGGWGGYTQPWIGGETMTYPTGPGTRS